MTQNVIKLVCLLHTKANFPDYFICAIDSIILRVCGGGGSVQKVIFFLTSPYNYVRGKQKTEHATDFYVHCNRSFL
jgi:hypothetical protein